MQPNRTCPYTPFHRYNTVYNTHLIQELQGLPWSWNCLKIGLVSSRGWLCKAYLACCTVLSKGDSWTEEGGRGGVLYHLPHGSHMAGCFLCITCYLMAAFYVSPVTSWLLFMYHLLPHGCFYISHIASWLLFITCLPHDCFASHDSSDLLHLTSLTSWSNCGWNLTSN